MLDAVGADGFRIGERKIAGVQKHVKASTARFPS